MIFLSTIDMDRWSRNRNVKTIYENKCPSVLHSHGNGYHWLNEKKLGQFKIYKRDKLHGFPNYSHVLFIMNTVTCETFACQAKIEHISQKERRLR